MHADELKIDIDALLPSEMAAKAETIGIRKARLDSLTLLTLGVLAGAFVSMGALFYTSVTTGAGELLPYGLIRLVGGLAFCLGLVLVVVAGAELFTGNVLIIMAWADGKVSGLQLLRNWGIVYSGNLIGSILSAGMVFLSTQYTFADGAVGANALAIANAKLQFAFIPAVLLGMFCNAMVYTAIWLTFSARSVTDKIMAVLFPITAFVVAGFEHSVANMYFIPVALLIKDGADPTFWAQIGRSAADYPALTWPGFLWANLLPVTLGNVIGGAGMVGLVYWFVYLRPRSGR